MTSPLDFALAASPHTLVLQRESFRGLDWPKKAVALNTPANYTPVTNYSKVNAKVALTSSNILKLRILGFIQQRNIFILPTDTLVSELP